MDDWVLKAMQRWPNVPALFGWLGLDRRGRWLIKGEPITHPRIVETIDRNYGVDEHGRWYFQNGPQRGYIELESAPFVLRRHGDAFVTHTGLTIERPTQVVVDEQGAVALATEHGFGEIASGDLDWILGHIVLSGHPIDEQDLELLLELPSGSESKAVLQIGREIVPVVRIDAADAPETFGFCRHPEPRDGERQGALAPD